MTTLSPNPSQATVDKHVFCVVLEGEKLDIQFTHKYYTNTHSLCSHHNYPAPPGSLSRTHLVLFYKTLVRFFIKTRAMISH